MCFDCLELREKALSEGITPNLMKYWGCPLKMKNDPITKKDIEIAQRIIRENKLGVVRPTKDFDVFLKSLFPEDFS